MSEPGVSGRETVVDAVLAGVVLAGVVGAAVVTDASAHPAAAVAGVLATVGAEAIAGRYAAWIRRTWRRRWVKGASVVLAALSIGIGTTVAPDPTLSAAGGALVAYLLLLAGVSTGIVPPPAAWPPR